LLLSSGAAFAEEPSEEDLDPDAGTRRPAAPDQRSGHVLLHGRFGLVAPFGSIGDELPSSAIVGAAPAFGAHLGVGVSRGAVLEVSGSYAKLPGASDCSETCSGTSLDLGLGLVYHAAQGIAFDPWVSWGAGYRRAVFEGEAKLLEGYSRLPNGVYHGLDIARLAMGGDFYPIPALGFGGFVALDLGTYVDRPQGLDGATYAFLQVGVRLALDPLPRPGRSAGKGPATARLPGPGIF
jgi:hypothetical protein